MDKGLAQAIAQLGTGKYSPGSSASPGTLYNPLPFPGAEAILCHRSNSHERWKYISRHSTFKDKSVLDFGCATGYFSFKANQSGARYVLGVDRDIKAIAVCQAAVKAYGVKNVNFIHGTERSITGDFDIAFAMSILQWLGAERAALWMDWAKSRVGELWVEIPTAKGDGRRSATWITDTRQWLSFWFTNVTKVGKTYAENSRHWRSLYLCEQ